VETASGELEVLRLRIKRKKYLLRLQLLLYPRATCVFQVSMNRLDKASQEEKGHEPAGKRYLTPELLRPSENDKRSRAQANQVDVMAKQEAKKPDKNDFLSMLRAKLMESLQQTWSRQKFQEGRGAGKFKVLINQRLISKKRIPQVI